MIELTIENQEEVLEALKYFRDFVSTIGGTGVEYLNDNDQLEFIDNLNVL